MAAIRDIALITIVLFILGLIIVFVVKVNHEVNGRLLEQPSINSTSEAVDIVEKQDVNTDLMDYVFLCVFIGFFFGVLVVGWIVSGHPGFSVFYFLLLIIFVFVALMFQFAWTDFTANVALVSTLARLPITNFILSNLGVMMTIMGLAGLATTYAKPYVVE